MQPGMSLSYVARRAGVAPSLLFNVQLASTNAGLCLSTAAFIHSRRGRRCGICAGFGSKSSITHPPDRAAGDG